MTDESAPSNSMLIYFSNPVHGFTLITPNHALTENTIFSWHFLTIFVIVHLKKLKGTLKVYCNHTLWEV